MGAQPLWVRRLMAVSLLVAAIGVVFMFAVRPLLDRHRDLDQALDHNSELLGRLVSLAQRKQTLAGQIDTLQERLRRDGRYLKSTTPALASAELQDRLKGAVQRFGGVLSSTQSLSVKNEDGFQRVALRVNANGPIQFLYGLFYSLEAGTPYLFIENVNITNRQARRRGRNSTVKENPQLTVRFDVYGYLSPRAR